MEKNNQKKLNDLNNQISNIDSQIAQIKSMVFALNNQVESYEKIKANFQKEIDKILIEK